MRAGRVVFRAAFTAGKEGVFSWQMLRLQVAGPVTTKT